MTHVLAYSQNGVSSKRFIRVVYTVKYLDLDSTSSPAGKNPNGASIFARAQTRITWPEELGEEKYTEISKRKKSEKELSIELSN